MGIDVSSATWAAWKAALTGAEPVREAGRPLRWRLGRATVTAAPELGREVGLEVEAASALALWAVPRAASLSEAGALATGDPAFDGTVLLVGDPRALAVLDAPTRAALRTFVGRRGRVDGGVLRLDATVTAALPAEAVAPALAAMSDLAARLDRAVAAFDAELGRLLEQADARVPAAILEAFPDHPAVVRARARRVADEATTADAAAEALIGLAEDRDLPGADRLRAARDALARLPSDPVAAAPLLVRLLRAPALPSGVRGAALERLLADGPLAALAALPATLWGGHAGRVVALMRQGPDERAAGARLLAGSPEALAAVAALDVDALTFVADALGAIDAREAAIEVLVACWRAAVTDATIVSVVAALRARRADLGLALAALDAPAFARASEALPRLVAAIPDPVPVLAALYPRLRDDARRVALVTALGRFGDARATDTLAAALDASDDAVVDAAIGALAEVGGPAALKPLERHAEGLFKDRGRKSLARAAIDRIRERASGLVGGLSVAADERGGLSVASKRGP